MSLDPSQLATGSKLRYNFGTEENEEIVEGTPIATVASNVGPVVILRDGTDFAFVTESELLTHGETDQPPAEQSGASADQSARIADLQRQLDSLRSQPSGGTQPPAGSGSIAGG